MRGLASPVVTLTGVGQNDIEVTAEGHDIIVQLSEAERAATDTRTIQQSLEIIRRRVDEVGTREPTIQRQGDDRILIQVPGIGSAAELKALIGTTARLTFNPVVGAHDRCRAHRARAAQHALPSMDEEGVFYILEQTPVVTRRGTGRRAALVRPERPPGGQLPLQPDRRAEVRRLHGGQHRPALRHRAGRRGDLGPRDPVGTSPAGRGSSPAASRSRNSTQLAVLLRAGALPAETDLPRGTHDRAGTGPGQHRRGQDGGRGRAWWRSWSSCGRPTAFRRVRQHRAGGQHRADVRRSVGRLAAR